MKNRAYFVINKAIIIIGLLSIFHSYHTDCSFDYFAGKTILKQYSDFVDSSNSKTNEDVSLSEAIIQYDTQLIKKSFFSKIKISLFCFSNICGIKAGNRFIFKQICTPNELFIEFLNLRI